MNLLLDTHLLIWAASMPERLSSAVSKLMEQPENQLYFSALSLWEITINLAWGDQTLLWILLCFIVG